ncbi:MAG: 4Fe-4S binding protein [Candidatus Eisenbacteria bacterium]|nr:4Fe-4S binding protein [Candidatus Eisenbacteria bacterium]
MTPQAQAKRIIWIRRGVQTLSLGLFLVLLFATHAVEQGASPDRFLKLYFLIDPLILLATWLATHTLAGLSLLALATVGVTLVLGRVFCGWICPFGVLHQALTWIRSRIRRQAPGADVFSSWQRAKYLLLVALLIMSLFGAHWIGVFDPAAMLYRSTTTTVVPAVQYVVEDGATAVYHSDPHVGPFHFTSVTEPVYRFFRDRVFFGQRLVFTGSLLLFALFAGAVLLNFYRPRFWCRYVCPLGALLGLCARRTALRLAPTDTECKDCGLCTISCPAAAQPEKPGEWLRDECFVCWNCVGACNRHAVNFRFEWPWKRPRAAKVSLSRRATLGALAGGVGGLLLFRIKPEAQARIYNAELIRPPGAPAEREFLQRCIQCGVCMKACPTNALQPALAQAGLEGVWSPILVPRLGYCEYNCNLCGQVCPTEAIKPLPLVEKQKVKIGLAVIDTTRCLPYAFDRQCIVCEEHCPIPTKAIYFVEKTITQRDGAPLTVKLPRVDPELCTGCGICETKCPFQDRAAIRVTSANEDRHPGNQPVLPGGGLDGLAPVDTTGAGSTWQDPYG